MATLLEAYNNPQDMDVKKQTPSPAASPTPSPTPAAAEEQENEEGEEEDDEPDESAKQAHGPVEMTPQIDAAFGEVARQRIARHPFRYYVWLPLKRARTMWFDTHSQYWPFEGTLLPFEDLDHDTHQHLWLPLFAFLTAVYTLLGLAGCWFLWVSENFAARRWLLLVILAMGLRLVLFSGLENPEPRYLVEFFPLLSVLGGIAAGQLKLWMKPERKAADERR